MNIAERTLLVPPDPLGAVVPNDSLPSLGAVPPEDTLPEVTDF